MNSKPVQLWKEIMFILFNNVRSPSLGACNYPILLSRRFHIPIYFWFEFISNSDPHRNLSDQLQSLARTNVDMSTWYRQVHVRLHCFILAEACSCRLELAYFVGKISKNRLVCKNAVALAYYGSCRLLVMGSCVSWIYVQFLIGLAPCMFHWPYLFNDASTRFWLDRDPFKRG